MSTRSFLTGCAVATSAIAFWINVQRVIAPRDPDPPLSVEQHFSPGEDLERIDAALIGEAGERLDMAAYVLTDYSVIAALTQAAARGAQVRVYRQPDERPPSATLAAALAGLAAAGAEIRAKPAGAPLMHLKAYCVDNRTLRIGAANFSHSGLTQQDNDLELYRFAQACDAFEADFEQP